jgi:class 3 adenylate cyclase/predicted esterase
VERLVGQREVLVRWLDGYPVLSHGAPMNPETKYARCGNLSIAYQVTGEGPLDLIFVPGLLSHAEFQWEEPTQARFFRRLSSFSRLIRFDKRGAGLSDRTERAPTIEERMDDIRAVMDAAGSEHAALLGLSEGGPLSLVFAATHPDRTSRLILWNTFASLVSRPDYAVGIPGDMVEQVVTPFVENWGTGMFLPHFVASAVGDPSFQAWWKRFERLAMSPGAAEQAMRINLAIDVRHVLPVVRTPTLVLHTAEDPVVAPEHGRYLAERIRGAKYVEVPGIDHFAWGTPTVANEVEQFLTGTRHHLEEVERVLATVLFTDIVGSTEQAARLGDRQWREVLERHDAIAERSIERHRGRCVKSTGDGVFATFDGPGRAIRCACSIVDEVRPLGIQIRAGLHTGEVEMRGNDLAGIAVHTGARVAGLAGPDEVLVSGTVKDLVAGSGIEFRSFGSHTLKGLPGEWPLFTVEHR